MHKSPQLLLWNIHKVLVAEIRTADCGRKHEPSCDVVGTIFTNAFECYKESSWLCDPQATVVYSADISTLECTLCMHTV